MFMDVHIHVYMFTYILMHKYAAQCACVNISPRTHTSARRAGVCVSHSRTVSRTVSRTRARSLTDTIYTYVLCIRICRKILAHFHELIQYLRVHTDRGSCDLYASSVDSHLAT